MVLAGYGTVQTEWAKVAAVSGSVANQECMPGVLVVMGTARLSSALTLTRLMLILLPFLSFRIGSGPAASCRGAHLGPIYLAHVHAM